MNFMDSEATLSRFVSFLTVSMLSFQYVVIGISWQNDPQKLVSFHNMYNVAVCFSLLLLEVSLIDNNSKKEEENHDQEMEANKTKSKWRGLMIFLIFDVLKVVIAIAPIAFPIKAILTAVSKHKLSVYDEFKFFYIILISPLSIIGITVFSSILRARGAIGICRLN